jgi:hypothetical protein
MTSPVARAAALGAVTLLAFACSSKGSATDHLCTPGAYVFCRCQNRDEGTKLCNKDGQSFAECLPCDGNAPVGGGGNDGLGEHGHSSAGDDPETPDTPSPPKKPPIDAGLDAIGPVATDDAGTSEPSNPTPTPPTAAPAAAHCKPLRNVAPKVSVQQIADEWPTPVGGTVKEGLYVQTFAVSYTGVKGDQGGIDSTLSAQTIEIMGDVGRYVFSDEGHDDSAGGFRLAVADGTVTVEYECPATAPRTFRYDAIGDDLAIYDTKVARFFTRQSGGSK